jgi:peptidoglycan/LPS O-acetylase OafA/YrhL
MAFVLLRGFRIRAAYATALHVLIAGYVLVFAAIPTTDKAFAGWYFSAVWTVPFAVLLITLAGSDRAPLSRLLSTRAMLTLGTASYALYLTHRPILAGLGDRLTGPASGGREWLLIATVFVFTLFVAEGAHRYVEVPARRFIVDLSHRFLGRPPARTPLAPAADEAVRTPGAAEVHDTIRAG